MTPAPRAPGSPRSHFNLSAAALRFPQLTLFFVLVVAVAGTLAYLRLGQREDPDFTFRAMVVRTMWPGATTEQVDEAVTDRIERRLQETPYFKWTRSHSKPGESLIVLELEDAAPASEVPQIWYQVRKKVGDLRGELPAEVVGPFFNDEFGDVFGTIYAFTADGLTMEELRRLVEGVRHELLRIPDVQKIELFGVQEQRIYVEISTQALATLGIDPERIAAQLQAQNLVVPAGTVQGASRAVPLRVSGQFDSVREVQELRLNIGGRVVRLGDAARVFRATPRGCSAATWTRRRTRCVSAAARRSGWACRWSPTATSSNWAAASNARCSACAATCRSASSSRRFRTSRASSTRRSGSSCRCSAKPSRSCSRSVSSASACARARSSR